MIGYLDMAAGVSGDMVLSCLVDGGWSVGELQGLPKRLGLPEGVVRISSEAVMRGVLRATLVKVEAMPTYKARHLKDIEEMVGKSDLPVGVKGRAIAIFTRLAKAEAKVHGMAVEKVHFHEVGALDAIVDIVGAAAGIEALGIERLYASALPLGHGWVKTEHGDLPLPAPATLEILAAAGAPTRAAPGMGELVTPTGAAIVAEVAKFEQPAMELKRIAVGAGQRKCEWPNVARLWLGEAIGAGSMVQIETNIDDMNPQLVAAVAERLLGAGAADVWLTPVQMKKGRPGVVLNVLASASREVELGEMILRETTTLGVRVHAVHRQEARREMRKVTTAFGEVSVKVKFMDGKIVGAMPEYEECKKLAEEKGVGVREVWEEAMGECRMKGGRRVQGSGFGVQDGGGGKV